MSSDVQQGLFLDRLTKTEINCSEQFFTAYHSLFWFQECVLTSDYFSATFYTVWNCKCFYQKNYQKWSAFNHNFINFCIYLGEIYLKTIYRLKNGSNASTQCMHARLIKDTKPASKEFIMHRTCSLKSRYLI